jgi:FkbM family methyltransferase
VLASKLVGSTGQVIAIEPQLRLQGVLQTNMYLNECCNVRIVRAAISPNEGEAVLYVTTEMNTGATSLFSSARYPMKTERVRSMGLPQLLRQTNVESCDLMKVDVEGAEYEIFTSSEDVLRSGAIRNIVVEFHDSIMEKRGLSPHKLHLCFIDCGYTRDETGDTWVYRFKG